MIGFRNYILIALVFLSACYIQEDSKRFDATYAWLYFSKNDTYQTGFLKVDQKVHTLYSNAFFVAPGTRSLEIAYFNKHHGKKVMTCYCTGFFLPKLNYAIQLKRTKGDTNEYKILILDTKKNILSATGTCT
jgi:hypothetical protein